MRSTRRMSILLQAPWDGGARKGGGGRGIPIKKRDVREVCIKKSYDVMFLMRKKQQAGLSVGGEIV